MPGLGCPNCKMTTQHKVTDSRPGDKGIWRKRLCRCGERFTTIEKVLPVSKGPLRKKSTFVAKKEPKT
jgi:transcriptional regulator NrdR family protein